MSTPLDLAVDIAGTLMRHRAAAMPLNVAMVAKEISGRHAGTGFSAADIADALAEESATAGMSIRSAPIRFP